MPDGPTLTDVFKVNINTTKLICFVDSAHVNGLLKHHYTTGLVFTFIGGAIIYKLKI